MDKLAKMSEKAAEARQKRVDLGLPAYQNPIEKAKNNPKSRSLAIKAMCYSCQGGTISHPPDAGWKWAIGNCTVLDCPLHPWRPHLDKQGGKPEGVYRRGGSQ